MYIKRKIESQILLLMKHFPSVAILGSRQVGKTTLAKEISSQLDKESVYLDLENPADSSALDHPVEFLNTVLDKTVIIDEIQRRPELFPVLRSVIDSNRINSRFILLGSASKDLLLMSNESLAGRIVYNELTPFFYSEISTLSDFRVHWLRGGYPVAFIQNDDLIRSQWQRSFLSAYIERDLLMLGLGTSSNDVQRLFYMIASVHGNLLNYSNLANSIGLSVMTVRNVVSLFEKSFIIRILQPYYTNIGKRLVKTPKVYFRDSGIINFLLGLTSYENMLRHPMLGYLWEGYVIENIINTLGDRYQYYYYRTADGTECDLVIFEGTNCTAAIDVKFSPAPKSTRSMTTAIRDLKPIRAFFIVPECKVPHSIAKNIMIATPDQVISLLQ
jgi:predicted AAA+ superfamily ATPase